MKKKPSKNIIRNMNGSVKKKPTKNEKYLDDVKRFKERDVIRTEDGPKDMG